MEKDGKTEEQDSEGKQADRRRRPRSFHAGTGGRQWARGCPDMRTHKTEGFAHLCSPRASHPITTLDRRDPSLSPGQLGDQLVHYSDALLRVRGSVASQPLNRNKVLAPSRNSRDSKPSVTQHAAGLGRSSQSALQGQGAGNSRPALPACQPLGPSKSASASGQPEPRTKCRRTEISTVPP